MTERLLACLAERANKDGLVLASEDRLLQELGVTSAELRTHLAKLDRAGLVKVLEPFPYLVLKLKQWSGIRPNATESAASAYSYPLLSQPKRLIASYRPAEQDLLSEILKTLGETNPASFEKAIELYSPHVIRTALDRVRRARDIRKSKTALFRHLLPRLARQHQHPA